MVNISAYMAWYMTQNIYFYDTQMLTIHAQLQGYIMYRLKEKPVNRLLFEVLNMSARLQLDVDDPVKPLKLTIFKCIA